MATVGPSASRHASSPYRRASKMNRAAPTQHPISDPYYGHIEEANICARFVTHLFACPELPPISTAHPSTPAPPLALFIAYALHRTRLHDSVTFASLYLLQRLKARFPAARGSSGHRLFISAFMLASKVICDDTYSNKSWSIVGQGMFALREINQMEREMCSYLEWQLNVEPNQLREFEAKVRRDFKGPGPYPNYAVPSPAPSPMPSTSPYGVGSTSAAPSFTRHGPSASPPKSAPHHPSSNPIPIPERAYPSPTSSPEAPDTPEASHSASTSPASTASPRTPGGVEDYTAQIVSPDGAALRMDARAAMQIAIAQQAKRTSASAAPIPSSRPQPHHQQQQQQQRSRDPIPQVPKRSKCGELFAFAAPISW